MPVRPLRPVPLVLFAAAALCAGTLQAQAVKPPKAQLWIDLSTGTMAGMPEMDMAGGAGGGLAGLMAGRPGGAPTSYGLARGMGIMPPRVLDIAFHNSLKPGVEAAQVIPAGMRMGESLPLLPRRTEAAAPVQWEPGEAPSDVERPKGRILVYWGCGESVRAGQPRVVDLARGSPADFAAAFAGRHAPDRGPRLGATHVLYPNERNTVTLARDSSLVGEHRIRGEGVPASMTFSLGEAQDVMRAIQLQTRGALQDSIALSWARVPQARAYYLHAMAQAGDDMILWSSAETPDTGTGLFDYLPDGTLAQWTRQRVLLAADASSCAVPKGIFAAPAGREATSPMLRMIAYGAESNFAHPPRPANPQAAWEPEWAVRVRVKSQTMAMLGQQEGGNASLTAAPPAAAEPPVPAGVAGSPAAAEMPGLPNLIPGLPVNPGSLLRGILGR